MIIALTVIHIVAHIVVAILKPSEARSEMDERERAIARNAGAIAYHVLAFGIVVAIGTTLFCWTAFVAVNAVLLAFILAETVRYGLEIIAYRRIWRPEWAFARKSPGWGGGGGGEGGRG